MFKASLIVAAAVLAMACATTRADQPHMQSALQALANARAELQQATHEKGGHRARAVQLVEQAMAEVRDGIEFDRHH